MTREDLCWDAGLTPKILYENGPGWGPVALIPVAPGEVDFPPQAIMTTCTVQ